MHEQLSVQIIIGCRMWPKGVGYSDIVETTIVCLCNELPITRSVTPCGYTVFPATKVQIYTSIIPLNQQLY